MDCPTPCDDDCEVICHEVHLLRRFRDHDPGACKVRSSLGELDGSAEAAVSLITGLTRDEIEDLGGLNI